MSLYSSNPRNGISRGVAGRRVRRPRGTTACSAKTPNNPARSGASFHGSISLVNGNGRTTKRRKRHQLIRILMMHKRFILRVTALWMVSIILIEFYFFYKVINVLDRVLLGGRASRLFDDFDSRERRRPPRPRATPPPKKSLLPKKVITVFGPESSGTTFLSTTLGVAVGAFTEDGGWFHVPAWAYSHDVDVSNGVRDGPDRMRHWAHPKGRHHQAHPKGAWIYEKDIERRAMSSDGEWEIQHLSLPWGWLCEEDDDIRVVEALVPEECFLYQSHPHLHPKIAENLWYPTVRKNRGKTKKHKRKQADTDENAIKRDKEKLVAMCRDEVKISSEENGGWTCGATCGAGKFNGYALYPRRFFVNITSHIEWYLSRGVDIKVVLLMRDRTISSKGKLRGHCHLRDVGRREDEAALSLMEQAMGLLSKRSPERDSMSEDVNGKQVVIPVSYEGLVEMGEAYLLMLYHQLGINASYVPSFNDGNRKYIGNVIVEKKEQSQNLQQDSSDHRPHPQGYFAQAPKEKLLPKKVITVIGSESSGTRFLSSTLGIATGSFSRKGQWNHIHLPSSASSPPFENSVFHKYNFRRAMSPDGEWEIQHLSLPWGWVCQEGDYTGAVDIVEALVPAECFRYEANPDLNPASAERFWSLGAESKLRASVRGTRRHGRAQFLETTTSRIDRNGEAAAEDASLAEKCRNEVHITEDSANFTCGAKCGRGQNNGFALYPKRFFVNVTSHIEWYHSRGVEITALISMRDHTISRKGKLREHCNMPSIAKEEYNTALSLMKESLMKYGISKSRTRPNVVLSSYEGLMQFQGIYLSYLYQQLGITSSYLPQFEDGNKKYVIDPVESLSTLHKQQKPKEFLLPRNVITVFGPESSGSTFLSSTLGAAVGIIDGNEAISRQKMSLDGEWEIQHLSLPWGWLCEEGEDINVVEALVPEECFRYEKDPVLESRKAGATFYKKMKRGKKKHISTISKDKAKKKKYWNQMRDAWIQISTNSERDAHKEDKNKLTKEDKQIMSKCRGEVTISEENDGWTCGATCGTGEYNGFALYPQRFFVNITSHIEWYLSRGVDIRVVLPMRDRTISSKGKRLQGHCRLAGVVSREDEVALSIMKEAMHTYGKRGSRRGLLPEDASGKERVFPISYEGLMRMQEVYLYALYKELRINSTHVPSFVDGNKKYVTNANLANLGTQEFERELRQERIKLDSRPPKPQKYRPPSPRESFLPKKMITVVGANNAQEVTSFDLTTTLSVAAGVFPSEGRWIKKSVSPPYDSRRHDEHMEIQKLMFEGSVTTAATSTDGHLAIQHLSLPWATKCDGVNHVADLVESLVPMECFRLESSVLTPQDPKIMEQCQNTVHIAEDSTNWTCGAKCGTGQSNGFAFYPKRFFVNITSHIEWYLSRGVDIAVVLTMRDHTVSMKEKLKHDCSTLEIAEKEDEMEVKIIKEAYEKYGKHGSLLKSGDKERVIIVSYEGIMEMQEVYLFDLYHQLRINSTYMPSFIDGNTKYVAADPILKAKLQAKAAWRKKRAPYGKEAAHMILKDTLAGTHGWHRKKAAHGKEATHAS